MAKNKAKVLEDELQITPPKSGMVKARLKCMFGDKKPNDIVDLTEGEFKSLHSVGFAEKV